MEITNQFPKAKQTGMGFEEDEVNNDIRLCIPLSTPMLSFPALLGTRTSVLNRGKREILESVSKLLGSFFANRLLPHPTLVMLIATVQDGNKAIEPRRLNLVATAKGFDVLGQIASSAAILRVKGKPRHLQCARQKECRARLSQRASSS